MAKVRASMIGCQERERTERGASGASGGRNEMIRALISTGRVDSGHSIGGGP